MDQNQPDKTDRRSFLTAEPLRRWWNQERAPESARPEKQTIRDLQPNSSNSEAKPGFLLELNKQAMACDWDAILNYGQYPEATEKVLEAFELVDQLENQLSVFRPESEVSRLNAVGFFHEMEVTPTLADLIQTSQELYQASAGAFDITSGPLTELWGFARRKGIVPTQKEIDLTLQHVGFGTVRWNEQSRTLRFSKENTKLNLGGIGKGFALERCCRHLSFCEINDFAVHAGQSSVVAKGAKLNRHTSKADLGWKVSLTDPLRPEKTLGAFLLQDVCLGTSGSGRQFFHYKGKRFSHIFDPRTGWPAEGVLSSTVIAPDATIADALATTCFILGSDGCEQLCKQLPDLAILLVVPKGIAGKEIQKFGPVDRYWQPTSGQTSTGTKTKQDKG